MNTQTVDWYNKFTHVYIDPDVADSLVARRFISTFNDKVTIGEPPIKRGSLSAKEFSQSKKQIHLTRFKGQFFKRCPGFHKGLACCNYFVMNLGFQCDMDCSYCYLQSFINSNYLTVFTNINDALAELRSFADDLKDQPLRVGTGEVIDSLSLDPLTLYSRHLIEFFWDFPQWILEFKTKTDFVDQFIDMPHRGNIVASWSINPPIIIDREEHGTASFDRRLQAARRCRDKNFKISFHIDPIIWHPEWKQSYAQLVDAICADFTPEELPYISLGALRFQPEQKHMMRERFGLNSLVTQAETFSGKDGKLRYDYDLRQEMFQFIINRFKEHNSRWRVFLCMETPESWLDSYGLFPHRQQPLKDLFKPIQIKNQEATL